MPTRTELHALGLIIVWGGIAAGVGVLISGGLFGQDVGAAVIAAVATAVFPPIFTFANRMKARAQKMMQNGS